MSFIVQNSGARGFSASPATVERKTTQSEHENRLAKYRDAVSTAFDQLAAQNPDPQPLTGSMLFLDLTDDNANPRLPEESELLEAHERLDILGYRFIGFKGNGEIEEGFKSVMLGVHHITPSQDDPWRGTYCGPLDVALGYAISDEGKAGALFRVYAPKNLPVTDVTKGTLADTDALEKIKTLLGDVNFCNSEAIIRGKQGEDEDLQVPETIASPLASKQLVVIPSAAQVKISKKNFQAAAELSTAEAKISRLDVFPKG